MDTETQVSTALTAPTGGIPPLPEHGLVPLKVVMLYLPISVSAFKHGVSVGIYPQPVHLGRRVAWRVADIRALIEGRPVKRRRAARAPRGN